MSAMDLDAPSKAQPYTYDLGHLLCTDPNPLPSPATEENLSRTAQQCAQALISQLLSTCPISRSESDGALQITLPAPEFHLPREKMVPKEKEKTKWERFAEKKGIKGKRKDGKKVFDEVKGEWVEKYGYKGKKGAGVSGDWLVEVDERAERKAREGGEKGGRKSGEKERRDQKIKARMTK